MPCRSEHLVFCLALQGTQPLMSNGDSQRSEPAISRIESSTESGRNLATRRPRHLSMTASQPISSQAALQPTFSPPLAVENLLPDSPPPRRQRLEQREQLYRQPPSWKQRTSQSFNTKSGPPSADILLQRGKDLGQRHHPNQSQSPASTTHTLSAKNGYRVVDTIADEDDDMIEASQPPPNTQQYPQGSPAIVGLPLAVTVKLSSPLLLTAPSLASGVQHICIVPTMEVCTLYLER